MLLFRFSDRDSFQFPRKVIEVDPAAKKVASEIHFANADMITSCAFGGPNLDELYVTSARFGESILPQVRDRALMANTLKERH